MPGPAKEELEEDLTEHRQIYHLWKGRMPMNEGEWILMGQNNEQATARGSRREVVDHANRLLEDPGVGGNRGALLVVEWEIVKLRGSGRSNRIKKIYVGEHMGAGNRGRWMEGKIR